MQQTVITKRHGWMTLTLSDGSQFDCDRPNFAPLLLRSKRAPEQAFADAIAIRSTLMSKAAAIEGELKRHDDGDFDDDERIAAPGWRTKALRALSLGKASLDECGIVIEAIDKEVDKALARERVSK